jgi:hypothetical protein
MVMLVVLAAVVLEVVGMIFVNWQNLLVQIGVVILEEMVAKVELLQLVVL